MFRVAFCFSKSDHARATHSALYFDLNLFQGLWPVLFLLADAYRKAPTAGS